MTLGGLIREAERVKRGGGVSDFTRMYNKMLRALKQVSQRIECYAEEGYENEEVL